MKPCVLHVDIDAFFASVEQLRNPALRGKPVAVGSGVVASASYEARRFGLKAGMPLRKARDLCPELTILAGHAAIYNAFAEEVFRVCEEYSPATETFLDEAYCDWSGTERMYPEPVAVAAQLQRRVLETCGLTVTVGMGRNKMLAKMASKTVKPFGLRQIPWDEEDAFIRGLPVIRLPGVGPKTEKLLLKLNVETIGEMRSLSRESLRAMLGLPGAILYDRCRGEDAQPISRREIPRSIRRETTFHQDAFDRPTIEGTLHYLTERAANTLRQLKLKARQLGVKIRYSDFAEESALRKLPSPTQRDSELFFLAVSLLDTLYTRRVALRLVGVTLTGFVPDNGFHQVDLFPAVALEEELGELSLLQSLDTIRERYGYASVVCGKSLELLGKLAQDDHGFILRTPSLTK